MAPPTVLAVGILAVATDRPTTALTFTLGTLVWRRGGRKDGCQRVDAHAASQSCKDFYVDVHNSPLAVNERNLSFDKRRASLFSLEFGTTVKLVGLVGLSVTLVAPESVKPKRNPQPLRRLPDEDPQGGPAYRRRRIAEHA